MWPKESPHSEGGQGRFLKEQTNYTSLTASSPDNPTNLTSVDSEGGFYTMMKPPWGGTVLSVPCPRSLAQ